jgi:hypothetical protein
MYASPLPLGEKGQGMRGFSRLREESSPNFDRCLAAEDFRYLQVALDQGIGVIAALRS